VPAEESKEPDPATAAAEKSAKQDPKASPWTTLVKEGAKALMPVLLTGASLLGFVAFAGAVIVWTRFDAIEVPPDQAVKVVPQAELVATGSSLLLLFGLFGIFAVLATYLVDRDARATPGMARALLLLVAVEGAVAIGLVEGASTLAQVGLIVGFVFVVLLAVLATFHERFARYEDVLEPREGETAKPQRGPNTLYDFEGKPRVSPGWPILIVAMFSALLVLAAVLVYGHPEGFWRLATWLLVARLGVGLAVLLVGAWLMIEGNKKAEDERRKKLEAAALKQYELEQTPRLFDDGYGRPPAPRPPKPAAAAIESEEAKRLRKPRPYRLEIGLWGVCLLCGIAAAAVALPAIVLGQWWLAVSFGAAFLLATGLWRVAGLSTAYFMWFGLAAFISVPLFGTLTLMARNVANPLVQPVAFIRSSDGPDEAIQGIYVTEASDRVYFADVATEGCSEKVKPKSGRLLWVPRSEVVAMSIGPLQDVEDAGTSALEMAYALTPSVETPAAGAVSLTVPEKKSKALEEAEEARLAKEAEAHAPQLDQRLENPGPAVRPNFGSGLSLVPEIALPGQTVELRLSVPNRNSGGFGPTPHGRTLRLNGAPVAIAREAAAKLSEAEFVKTEDGQELSIEKQALYGKWGQLPYLPKPFLLAPGNDYRGPRFVRLIDGQVSAVGGGGFPGTEYSQFLRFHLSKKGQPVLKGDPEVTLKPGAEAVPLEAALQRQAWDRDRISFGVPEHASSGVITVDCGQLAGQPLLRVAEPPSARIAVRMQPGSNRVAFDGAGSRAASGGALTERWTVGGQVVGKRPQMTLALPSRNSPYEVRLTVTDAHGKVDTAQLTLLRLPAPRFNFDDAVPRHLGRIEEERRVLLRAVRHHPPASIEVDGNADDPGSDSYNDDLSLRRAENLRDALLAAKGEASASASASTAAPPPVPVTTRALGESCPIAKGGGRQPANRRVEVFVLDAGVSVEPPPDCRAAEVRHTTW
jgi:outer membrane protein OmpA-like peptidoglycan-associated protein